MYAIFRKAINESNLYPTLNGEKVIHSKNMRKYRSLIKAESDFIILKSLHPEYLWQIRETKLNILCRSNSNEVLKVWNQNKE